MPHCAPLGVPIYKGLEFISGFFFKKSGSIMTTNLLQQYKQQLLKAIGHLNYSSNKVQNLTTEVNKLTEEELESWEGFSSRFSRVSEIFLGRFIRAYILNQDPGFTGTFRDFLNQAEKLGLINNTQTWLKIREYRNKEAHEYNEESLGLAFEEMRQLSTHLLKLVDLLDELKK
jgi:hypothetical protein